MGRSPELFRAGTGTGSIVGGRIPALLAAALARSHHRKLVAKFEPMISPPSSAPKAASGSARQRVGT